jgi:hypothetical protein
LRRLSLSVNSTVRSGALVFPVPDPHATLTAGPTDLFTDLAKLAAPPPQVQKPGYGGADKGTAQGPGVSAENRQQIRPRPRKGDNLEDGSRSGPTPGMTVTRAFPVGDLTIYPELRRVAVGEVTVARSRNVDSDG